MSASVTTGLPNNNPLAYMGVQPRTPPNNIVAKRDPTSLDNHHAIGTDWENTTTGSFFKLTRYVAGVPDWALASAAAGDVTQLSLTGTNDTGGPVTPTAGNINFAGGSGITFTGSGSTITANVVGGGTKTVTATVATQMAPNTAYFVPQLGSLAVLTLPLNASCNLGDIVTVYGVSTNFFQIAQNAAQQVNMVSVSTTAGATGSLTSKETFDSITLKYCGVISAVGQWVATAVTGTYTKA